MKKLDNSPSSIPTFLHNNCMASSDNEKASMLNQFFSNCFNIEDSLCSYSSLAVSGSQFYKVI